MPAASERGPGRPEPELPDLPVTWRPLGPRIAGLVAGGGLALLIALTWIGFDDKTKHDITIPQRITVVGAFLLGFACLYALIRSRVQAREDRLVVVNGYRRHEFAYAQIVAVTLSPGAPWVVLDLADGETCSAMGIQGSDGARARLAVRQLRALVERAHAPGD